MARKAAAPLRSAGLALALVGASALAHPSPATSTRPTLPVLWVDLAGVQPLVAETMRREVRSLLEPTGLELAWQAREPEDDAPAGAVRVVAMPSGSRGALRERAVLGSVRPEGAPPTVWIYYPGLTRALGVSRHALPALRGPERRRLGVALGRIVAHELVHALIPEQPHDPRGVMARQATLAQLLRGHAQLSPESLEALRTAVRDPR